MSAGTNVIAPPSPVDSALKFDNLVECLLHRESSCNGRVGLRYVPSAGEVPIEITHRSAISQAKGVAGALQQRGLARERVLLMCDLGHDYVIAFLGCVLAGAIAVPFMPTPGSHHQLKLVQVIRDCQPQLIVCASRNLPTVRRLVSTHGIEVELLTLDSLEAAGATWTPHRPASDDIAFLQYTSGSTGTPKGVKVTHLNLVSNLAAITDRFGLSTHSRGLVWLPPYHDMGLIGGLLTPLFVGYPITLMSPLLFAQKPALWLQCISRYRITATGGPSFGYRHCADSVTEAECEALDLSSWETAYNGAERVCEDTLARFTRRFAPHGFNPRAHYPTYGLAEATLLVTAGQKGAGHKTVRIDQDGLRRDVVSCGTVIEGHELAIVDPETCVTMPDGQSGEIWLRGPSITPGYWSGDEESFSASMTGSSMRWLRTGDLGMRVNGELHVLGRRKELIIVRGTNHYPADIERAAARVQGPFNPTGVVAFAIDENDQEAVVLMVETLRHTPSSCHAEIQAGIRQAVAVDCGLTLDHVVLVRPGSLKRTSSGKLMRTAMREVFQQQRASDLTVPQRI
jgi:acyl-CoA synthetase (AMP-forming)/AMP-acid ligase II